MTFSVLDGVNDKSRIFSFSFRNVSKDVDTLSKRSKHINFFCSILSSRENVRSVKMFWKYARVVKAVLKSFNPTQCHHLPEMSHQGDYQSFHQILRRDKRSGQCSNYSWVQIEMSVSASEKLMTAKIFDFADKVNV